MKDEATGPSSHVSEVVLGAFGCGIFVAFWAVLSSDLFLDEVYSDFRPAAVFSKLIELMSGDVIWTHVGSSLKRLGVGLGCATLVGIPVGVLIGQYGNLRKLTQVAFQTLRMISPLAWTPIAIIAFGVGDKPVYFLVGIAAVWPIVINTAHGVSRIRPVWSKVARSLGASEIDVLRRVVIPAVIPDIMSGMRIALGIAWIVLVPAEMLGVADGLGYFILDTRDRFDYGELGAAICIIGVIGFMGDGMFRILQGRFSWRQS